MWKISDLLQGLAPKSPLRAEPPDLAHCPAGEVRPKLRTAGAVRFRPEISCNSSRLAGAEAFIDGRPPDSLGAAEIRRLVDCAVAALRTCADAGAPPPQIALTIPVAALSEGWLADHVIWECDRLEVPPHRLLLRAIRGDAPLLDGAAAGRVMGRLADAACGLDLDDLPALRHRHADLAGKAARRVRVNGAEGMDAAVLSIMALADHLGLPVLAERIETRDQLFWLAQIGCDMVSGPVTGAPLDAEELALMAAQGGSGAAARAGQYAA
ncbi:MAG: EAL domain-containing protein [Paracoccus sp. (in: a-proteobacteria)]|nr:EAL domain-containing protein [Paracoccus sp. (in: a-proteobacteria)]